MTYTLAVILVLVGVAASAIMVIGLWDAVHGDNEGRLS
jgi:hypothetical protein